MAISAARSSGHVYSGSLRIPLRNVWLLLLYASDLFKSMDASQVQFERDAEEIPDLAAEILVHQVTARLRRNLTFGYRRREQDLTRLRGRIDLLRTERFQLLSRGRIACGFDELTVDTDRNQFVLAALNAIAPLVKSPGLAIKCRELSGALTSAGVSTVRSRRLQLNTQQFGRGDAQDRPMIDAARLSLDLALPTEEQGASSLGTHTTDERWMQRLFERAVGGFYSVVLPRPQWTTRTGTKLNWQTTERSRGIGGMLPGMQTDILLVDRDGGRELVIDTKFTALLKPGKRDGEERLKSGYIYQMYAYLRSQELPDQAMSMTSAGLLLHPSIDVTHDEYMVVNDHAIRFATVDLAGSASEIRARLLAVVEVAGR